MNPRTEIVARVLAFHVLRCSRGEMEEESDFRRWDELIPDALGLIFRNLSLKEVLTVIPMVCKSWSKAVSGPYCWQEIDIEEWSRCCHQPEKIDRMLEMLIRRSSGSPHKLCVSRLQNDAILAFIAEKHNDGKPPQDDEANAIAATVPRSKHLEMAYNLISKTGVLKILARCSELEYLDLRGCWEAEYLDDKFLKERFPKLKVLGPVVMDVMDYEIDESDYCSDFSYDVGCLYSDYTAGELDDENAIYNDEYAVYDPMWG